jgi:hypothetical protein
VKFLITFFSPSSFLKFQYYSQHPSLKYSQSMSCFPQGERQVRNKGQNGLIWRAEKYCGKSLMSEPSSINVWRLWTQDVGYKECVIICGVGNASADLPARGNPKTCRILNFFQGYFGLISFFWQRTVLLLPVARHESDVTKNYEGCCRVVIYTTDNLWKLQYCLLMSTVKFSILSKPFLNAYGCIIASSASVEWISI